MSTFNGFGTTYYGRARRIGDTFVITKWIAALYFPLAPIKSYRVRITNQSAFTVIVFSRSNTNYQILEVIPLKNNLGQVLRTWCFTLAPLAYVAAASTKSGVRITAAIGIALALGFLLLSALRARA